MKIGINLVGVSYNNAKKGGRLRNYEDSIENFFKFIINPLKEKEHEIKFYLFSYQNEKQEDIINNYSPCLKHSFINDNLNRAGGGDKNSNGYKVMSITYLNSLYQIQNEDLDLIISTRFDINFFHNPFDIYKYDFQKMNFLWREPEYMDVPIVNDTFVVFPYKMLNNVIDSIKEMEENPPKGINVAMHNWYLPMVNQVGEENVQWVDDKFITATDNKLYKLTRKE